VKSPLFLGLALGEARRLAFAGPLPGGSVPTPSPNSYSLNFFDNKLVTRPNADTNDTRCSSGNDMAAIFGTIGAGDKSGSYLRIWRHEKYGWKIGLEVIKF
jgi:hypothetical protein